jgi:hypothetical protein
MNATLIDDRRRLVMPPELPPRSAVTVQQLDADTWIVRRHKPDSNLLLIALPRIKKLPSDPEWQAIERRMVDYSSKNVPPFEE